MAPALARQGPGPPVGLLVPPPRVPHAWFNRMPRPIIFWLSMPAATALAVWSAWGASFPLGVPGQWEWPRLPAESPFWLRLVVPLLAAAGYLGFVLAAAARAERARPVERCAWLWGLVLAGFGWLSCIQEAAPTGYQLSKAGWVLYFPKSSGYFTEARRHAPDMAGWLAGYEALLSRGDVLHLGTHPPGLILFMWSALELCERSPGLVAALAALETDSARDTFNTLAHLSRQPDFAGGQVQPLSRADRAALWLALLAAQASAALTVLPLYGLARRGAGPRAALIAASFWPCVPAVAIFLPKADAAFPFLACGCLFVWLRALDRGSIGLGILAGCALFCGLFLSLAFLVVAIMGAAFWALRLSAARAHAGRSAAAGGGHAPARRLLAPGAAVLATMVALTVAASAIMQFNLPRAWQLNLVNHAGFYLQYERTWWKWLLVNPLETWAFAGAPLGCAGIWSAAAHLRRWPQLPQPAWACGGTWLALYLSGKTMGEAARLWLFLMPLLCWLAAPLFAGGPNAMHQPSLAEVQSPGQFPGLARTREWAPCLALQLLAAMLLVPRIGGFHY